MNCRGGTPWPPSNRFRYLKGINIMVAERWGGHGVPPLQLRLRFLRFTQIDIDRQFRRLTVLHYDFTL
jgi:hypothetical protein